MLLYSIRLSWVNRIVGINICRGKWTTVYLIQEPLDEQLKKQTKQQLEALEMKLKEQSREQNDQLEAKLKQQSEEQNRLLEAKLKEQSKEQSEQLEAKLKVQSGEQSYTSTVWWLSKIDRSGYLCLLLLCCTLVHALKEIFNKGKNGGRKKEGWDQNQFHSVTHVLQTLTLGLTLHNLVLSTMLLLWKLLHCCTVLSSTKHFLRYFIRFTKQIIITKRTA